MSFAQPPKRPRARNLAPEQPCLECVRGPHTCANETRETTPGGPGLEVCDPLMLALGVWATKAPEGYIAPKPRRAKG